MFNMGSSRYGNERTNKSTKSNNASMPNGSCSPAHYSVARWYGLTIPLLSLTSAPYRDSRVALPPQKRSLTSPSPSPPNFGRTCAAATTTAAPTPLIGLPSAISQRVPPLPLLVREEPLHGGPQIVRRLLQVQLGDVVLGTLAGNHPAADLGLAGLLLLALDGPRAERHAGRVVRPGDQDGFARREEVVGSDVVVAAEDGRGDVVPQGEGGDGVVCGVEEV